MNFIGISTTSKAFYKKNKTINLTKDADKGLAILINCFQVLEVDIFKENLQFKRKTCFRYERTTVIRIYSWGCCSNNTVYWYRLLFSYTVHFYKTLSYGDLNLRCAEMNIYVFYFFNYTFFWDDLFWKARLNIATFGQSEHCNFHVINNKLFSSYLSTTNFSL